MADGRARSRIIAITFGAPVVLVLLSTWAIATESWNRFRVPTMLPVFADLRQVTATADCVMANPAWSLDSASCDVFGRAYNYPSVWARAFAVARLGEDRTELLGIVLLLGFCLACASLLWLLARSNCGHVTALVCSASIFAPPSLLAIERGNTDLVIFALTTIAMLLQANQRLLLSVPFLALGTSLKFFPIGAVVSLLRRFREVGVFLALFVAFGGVLLVAELPGIANRTPQSIQNSYGVSVVPSWLLLRFDSTADLSASRALGLVLFVALAAGLRLFTKSRFGQSLNASMTDLATSLKSSNASESLFLVGSGSFLVSYLVGSSFDYRLIFLIPCVIALGIHATTSVSGRALLVCLVAVMYLSYPLRSFEMVGDFVLLVVAPVVAVLTSLTISLPELKGPITSGFRQRRKAHTTVERVDCST